MASDDLNIQEIAVVGEQDHSPTLGASSPTSPVNSFPPLPDGRTSPTFVHGFLSLPTPIPRNSQISPDDPAPPTTRTSDLSSSHQPPFPTLSAHSSGSIRWATSTLLRKNNPEDHVSLPSLGLPTSPPQVHHRKGRTGIGSIFTGRDDPSDPGLSPVCSGQSNVPNARPSFTNPHVDAGSDTSHSSSVTNFFKRAVQRIRHPSRGETDVGLDTTQADLNVKPFAFKPLQLASVVNPKSLENLEKLGGVEGLLRGLGTDRVCGLSTRPTCGLRDPGTNAATSDGVEMTSLKTNIALTSPTSVQEGPQSTATLGGGSGVGRPSSPNSASAYESTIKDRQRIYGQNIFPKYPRKSLRLLMWLAIQDKVLISLSTAAVASLVLGLSQDFGTTRPQVDHPVDWVEGVAIITAILIVVAVGSLNDWQRERQFQALDEKREARLVKVIRDGEERQIDVHQVVVGDVVLLEPGEVIPCDGVFLSGHNVRCDESRATEESNAIKKLSYEECIALGDKRLLEFDPDGPSGDGESVSASQRKTNSSGLELLGHTDCFIISGSKVVEGVGSYVVISFGAKNFNGRITMALRRDSENTPLQLKLNDLSEIIAKIGSIAGGLLFAALLVRYFVQLGTNNPQRTSSEKGIAFVNIFIVALTLVVVAVPEGLPLIVTHALAFATKRMSKENLLGVLGSCETMANASVVCTNKIGTLTQNEMTVVAVSVGVHAKSPRSLEENRVWTGSEARSDPKAKDFGVDLANLVNDSVRRFLQFQISSHFTTVIVMIVWALRKNQY
ncbi:E1-E2 ATPase-domain-containing protein [Lactarius pseudohatsudake]|nr:E1-E2 ATPase-domain-containing protein [Lactarius pseudohatsudake]